LRQVAILARALREYRRHPDPVLIHEMFYAVETLERLVKKRWF
jgi:hypothetical protein